MALGKGLRAPVQIKWGAFFYTPLHHDLSAHSIKRNNAFHKYQGQKTSAIAAPIKSNVCS